MAGDMVRLSLVVVLALELISPWALLADGDRVEDSREEVAEAEVAEAAEEEDGEEEGAASA